jgi:hypothetical protein
MNKNVLSLLTILAALTGLQPRAGAAFVVETSAEFLGCADLDGDGRPDQVIVDKATGAYRIGYQRSTNYFTWAAARASGIPHLTGFAMGRFFSDTVEGLVFAAPDANRLNAVTATNYQQASLPITIYMTNLGPYSVGAIDIGGAGNTSLDDLAVVSIYNETGPVRQTLLRNQATNAAVISDTAIAGLRDRLNPIELKSGATPYLAWMARGFPTATSDSIQVCSVTSGVPAMVLQNAMLNTLGRGDYLCARFSPTNPLAQLITFWKGNTTMSCFQVLEPSPGTYSLQFITGPLFATNIETVFLIPGPSDTRLLVIFAGGTLASIYSFDGVNPLLLVKQLTPAAGEHFTGSIALGHGGFVLYSAAVGQEGSAKFTYYVRSGADYNIFSGGDLSRISPFSGGGNVLQFRYEPLVVGQPVLLQVNNAGDWTGQPQFLGSPVSLSVNSESFRNASNGLGNATAVGLGKAHPLAQFALANQYTNSISFFSFQAAAGEKGGDVAVSPPPGKYKSAINIQFTAADPPDQLFFRSGLAGPWLQYTGQPVRLFTNATLAYYGKSASGPARSEIKYAAYTFGAAAGQLDSDNDGVPDFVESAKGLDPTGGRDSDGDGFSDLEELLHGTDPSNPNSFPSTNTWAADRLHVDDKAMFDLQLTAKPWDGLSNQPSLCLTGAVLYAYDMQGAFLASGVTSNLWPAARLAGLPANPQTRLFVQATDLHYPIVTTNTDKKIGRELIGLRVIPPCAGFGASNTWTGGNLTNQANLWIQTASNAWMKSARLVLTNQLELTDTLSSVLFETKVALLFRARGSNWWTNLTLFPHRPVDAARFNLSQEQLLSLEHADDLSRPAYSLQAVFLVISNRVAADVSTNVGSLRTLTREIYRVSSAFNNANPAAFPSPVDEIRCFLWTGVLHSNYLACFSSTNGLASALTGAGEILSAVQPRPYTNVLLVVRSDTFQGSCRLLNQSGTGLPFVLVNESGLPYSFPGNFDLVEGAKVLVGGYADATSASACPGQTVEVAALVLTDVPALPPNDSDGNLLPDNWEQFFFGSIGVNPFADDDGDGFTNLQEFWDGTDPRIGASHAAMAAALHPPTLHLTASADKLHLSFQWPAAYADRIQVTVKSTTNLGEPFQAESSPTLVPLGNDWLDIPISAETGVKFYLIELQLKPNSGSGK